MLVKSSDLAPEARSEPVGIHTRISTLRELIGKGRTRTALEGFEVDGDVGQFGHALFCLIPDFIRASQGGRTTCKTNTVPAGGLRPSNNAGAWAERRGVSR